MKKILLALLCGGLLAMPSMANAAAKHKRPHASKHVKKHKRAARTTIASADTAPIVRQVRDDEAPRR